MMDLFNSKMELQHRPHKWPTMLLTLLSSCREEVDIIILTNQFESGWSLLVLPYWFHWDIWEHSLTTGTCWVPEPKCMQSVTTWDTNIGKLEWNQPKQIFIDLNIGADADNTYGINTFYILKLNIHIYELDVMKILGLNIHGSFEFWFELALSICWCFYIFYSGLAGFPYSLYLDIADWKADNSF